MSLSVRMYAKEKEITSMLLQAALICLGIIGLMRVSKLRAENFSQPDVFQKIRKQYTLAYIFLAIAGGLPVLIVWSLRSLTIPLSIEMANIINMGNRIIVFVSVIVAVIFLLKARRLDKEGKVAKAIKKGSS